MSKGASALVTSAQNSVDEISTLNVQCGRITNDCDDADYGLVDPSHTNNCGREPDAAPFPSF